MTTLGQRIKTIRQNADMDRQIFATYIKVAGGAELIKQWENNEKRPDENALERIAVLGQTSPLTLACGKEINPYAIAWLLEHLEERKKEYFANEYSNYPRHVYWLCGQVYILNKLKEWEND